MLDAIAESLFQEAVNTNTPEQWLILADYLEEHDNLKMAAAVRWATGLKRRPMDSVTKPMGMLACWWKGYLQSGRNDYSYILPVNVWDHLFPDIEVDSTLSKYFSSREKAYLALFTAYSETHSK